MVEACCIVTYSDKAGSAILLSGFTPFNLANRIVGADV